MALLLVAGFVAGRDVIAPRFLSSGKVGAHITQPVRILSPEEARVAARDEPSHVWTEGVKPSDIPKLEPSEEQRPRTRRRSRPAVTGTPATPEPAVDAPVVPDQAETPEPTDSPAVLDTPVLPDSASTKPGASTPNHGDSTGTSIPQD